METFPETVLYSFPLVAEHRFKTYISKFESGKEQRRKVHAFPTRAVGLNHRCVKLSEFNDIFRFYYERSGAYETFWFVFPQFGGNGKKWYGEYIGRGDGGTTTFDLRSKNTNQASVTIYVNSVSVSFSFIQGGGQAGSDRIDLSTPPAEGAIVTADFEGQLILKTRFEQDNLTEEIFSVLLIHSQIGLIEVKNP